MIVTETVEGLDGSLGVLFSFVTDEGEASRLPGIFVLKIHSTIFSFFYLW